MSGDPRSLQRVRDLRVHEGDRVEPGDALGVVWYSGYVQPSGPGGLHVHWSLAVDGVFVDPLLYLEDDSMTDAEKAEIGRIADIFDGWAKLRKARADIVNTLVGQYGITDSLDAREAKELQGAVDGLRALLS